MSSPLYRIKNWLALFENNRTRELRSMSWVPIPNKHDSDGYTLVVDRPNGAAIYGAWIACVQVASKCDPRGTLLRHDAGPHTPRSIARMIRMPEAIVAEMLEIVTSTDVGWVETLDYGRFMGIPQVDAGSPQVDAPRAYAGKGREQKGTEGNGREGNSQSARAVEFPSVPCRVRNLHPDANAILEFLNESTKRSFRAVDANLTLISQRLHEPNVDPEGVRKMVLRQIERWRGTRFEEYLQPKTLFAKGNFDGYYSARDLPVTHEANGHAPKTPSHNRNKFIMGAPECEY